MKQLFLLLLILCTNSASGETFATVEAYLAYLTNGKASKDMVVQTFRNGLIVGAVQWSQPENASQIDRSEVASVFVLEKIDSSLKEIAHSFPSGGFSGSAMEVLDGVEIQSKSTFLVRFSTFKPQGFILFRFAQRGETWFLTGRDQEMLDFKPESGDEAVGDTRAELSTNFLTGETIESHYGNNKLISSKHKKDKFPKFPLSTFNVFDERYGSF